MRFVSTIKTSARAGAKLVIIFINARKVEQSLVARSVFKHNDFDSITQVTNADVQKKCPAFIGGGCPYSKLPEEKKGIAGKCPAFAEGVCPFAKCKSVGEFQEKLGEMRDQCKGDGAYQEFLKAVMLTSKEKEVQLGHGCPFFGKGCPFAHGKDIMTPKSAVVSSFLACLGEPGT